MPDPGELSQAQRDQLLTQIAGNLSIIKDEIVLRRVKEDGKALAVGCLAESPKPTLHEEIMWWWLKNRGEVGSVILTVIVSVVTSLLFLNYMGAFR